MASNRANRGYNSARNWNYNSSGNRNTNKGEVILRLVSDGVKTVTNLRPALSYWEAGGESTMWV